MSWGFKSTRIKTKFQEIYNIFEYFFQFSEENGKEYLYRMLITDIVNLLKVYYQTTETI